MSRSKGKRYDGNPKLNIKKVVAVIVAIIVIIMVIISLKNLLNGNKTKDVSSLTTYITVYTNNKWGVINNKGEIIIEPTYDELIIIPDSTTDLFVCTYDVDYENGTYKTKILNEKAQEILTDYNNIEPIENTDDSSIWYESDVLKYKKNGKYGLINFNGKKIIDAEYDNIYSLTGIEKSIIIEKDGKKGLVSTSMGEIIIEAEYLSIASLTETYENGYIVETENNKFGVISADKKMILETKYDQIKNVKGNDYYVVMENNVLEVINKTGEVLLSSGYDSIESIDGDNLVIIKNNKYGVISVGGQEVIPAEYEDLKYTFKDYYIVKKSEKYGIISTTNEVKLDFQYNSMDYIKTGNFITAENSDYTTDIINSDFEIVLNKTIISEISIDSGYLRVRIDGEYKYYNFKLEEKTNKEILITNTLFLVKQNGKYGYENKSGDLIVDYIYDDAKEQNQYGYCSVKKDGVWGSLKSDGAIVASPSINLDDYLYIDFIADWYRYNDLSLYIYVK